MFLIKKSFSQLTWALMYAASPLLAAAEQIHIQPSVEFTLNNPLFYACYQTWSSPVQQPDIGLNPAEICPTAAAKSKPGVDPNLVTCETAAAVANYVFDNHLGVTFSARSVESDHPQTLAQTRPSLPQAALRLDVDQGSQILRHRVFPKVDVSSFLAQNNQYEELF